MSDVPGSDEPLQTTSNSAPNLEHAASSKRRQICVTVDLLQRILDAARTTGNNTVHDELKTEFSLGCLIHSHDQLPVRPPNPSLIAKESRLRTHLAEIAQRTVALRQKAKPILLERARRTADAAVSRMLANPAFPTPSDRVCNISLYSKPSLSSSKPVDDAIDRVTSLRPAIQKTCQQAKNTKGKLTNIYKVLVQLKDDATQQVSADATPSVNADWTVSVKASLNTPGYSSPTIPTRPPPMSDDDPDDPLASPFVTPRSKTRKRAARSINGMVPIRFQLPR